MYQNIIHSDNGKKWQGICKKHVPHKQTKLTCVLRDDWTFMEVQFYMENLGAFQKQVGEIKNAKCLCFGQPNSMMTSPNGNIFRVTGPLWGDPMDFHHKGRWRALMFFCDLPENKIEHTIETPVIWDAITLILTSL